ncbi:MAG: Gfo/Idh/MocA family protein [Armatimonadota bacterium]
MLSPSDYRPTAPERSDYGIGIVGCGGIVRHAHLPAYRQFGYRVTGCCDIDPAAVRAVQEQFDVPFGTTQVEELIYRNDVEIIDLAVHASVRREVMEVVSRAGKPILSQKPFAMSWDDAAAMVRTCRERGVKLMVNQQARWAPVHRAIRQVIESGVLGPVYSVVHFARGFQDEPGSWFVNLVDFNIVDHGIHYIDLVRYFTGRTPLRVKATAAMVPGQVAVSPMHHAILMEFEPDAHLTAMSHFNNIVQTRALHGYDWYIDGTEGSVHGTWSEVALSLKAAPEVKQVFAIKGQWFPDAFGGSMGELMRAIQEDREPSTSGQDNLNSIKIAYAAVRSAETGRAVELAEIG